MDPIAAAAIAYAEAVTALAKMVTVIVEGQSLEQRQKLWDWYIADVTRLRKLLKLDG